MHLSYLLSLLTATASAVSAASLTITIPTSNVLPNPNTLPAGTHATLTTLSSSSHLQDDTADGTTKPYRESSPLVAPLTRSSTFVFRNLPRPPSNPKLNSNVAEPSQSYLLDIRSAEYVFAPYRVDLDRDGSIVGVWETQRGSPWSNRGPEKFVASSSPDNVQAGAAADVVFEARVVSRKSFYEERSKCE